MKWKPVGLVFILALGVFLGVFSFYGSEIATGTVVGGHITVDTTWDLAKSPFMVMENVIVDPGVTLTIEPGVEVKFDPPGMHDYLHLYVEGHLVSIGQSSALIDFTTNEDPPRFGWGTLQINNSGIADIRNCNLSHGFGLVLKSDTPHNIIENTFYNASIEVHTPDNLIANNSMIGDRALYLAASNNTASNNYLFDTYVLIHGSRSRILENIMVQGFGIRVEMSNDNIIANNTLDLEGFWARIYLEGRNNSVISNVISGSSKYAIDMYDSENATIYDNEIGGFWDTGIGISLGRGNRILDNRITGGSIGVGVASFLNSFIRNVVSRASQYGIILVSGSNLNSVYHNVFSQNSIQARDDQNTNSWDNGYPSGGNYWSDYQGNDTFSGPNQDIPGGDGIGDNPYAVNPNGTDRYPFTEPTKGSVPPRNLNAHLTGTNYENVTLTWNLSWNDGQRANDVTRYEIYRCLTYDKGKIGYPLAGSTPNQTTQYVDSLSGEGDPNNYFYYVCAINGTGNSSCSSGQAGKFTRPLSTGSNLVSIPLIQSDESIQMVLETVSYDNAWSYDPINQEWRSFSKSKPYGQSLEYLNHTKGIWVNITQDSNLTVAGVVPTSTTINLQTGWSLVGFPSFDDNYKVGDLKAIVAVERIEAFDALSPPYFLRAMNDGDFLQAGFGYWIRVESPAVLTVENT